MPFTIDLVPLVLEKTCFAGHTFEYKWKINKTKQKGTTESVKPRVCFSRIFRDVGRRSVPWWESSVEDVPAEGLRAW